jgi:hypothetical protein
VAAGAFGFLTLIHVLDGPDLYGRVELLRDNALQAKLANRFEHFHAVAFGVFDVFNPTPCALSGFSRVTAL